MEKILRIVNLRDKQNDFLYWSSKSELERLTTIELLRQQYINYTKNVQSRLRRVCRIINQKQG